MIHRFHRFHSLEEKAENLVFDLWSSAPSAGHAHCRRQRGFTLIELVLVMVMLTVILAIAMPSVRGFAANSRSRDAASQLVSLGQWAKARAAVESRVYRLNSDGATYWFTAEEGDEFVPVGGDFGREFELPPGTRAELVSNGGEALEFHPDGRSTAVMLRLVDDNTGRVTTLAAPSPAESFRVLTPEEAQRL